MPKQPAVYILASKRNGTLYIGVTSDLKSGLGSTKWVNGVFFRETQINKWKRAWKLELIEKQNSDWRDLWEEII